MKSLLSFKSQKLFVEIKKSDVKLKRIILFKTI